MYPYPHEYDNQRKLLKTSNSEAIDPISGEKYRLEKIENAPNFSVGIVVGIFVAGVLFWALNNGLQPSSPSSTPTETHQSNPESFAGKSAKPATP